MVAITFQTEQDIPVTLHLPRALEGTCIYLQQMPAPKAEQAQAEKIEAEHTRHLTKLLSAGYITMVIAHRPAANVMRITNALQQAQQCLEHFQKSQYIVSSPLMSQTTFDFTLQSQTWQQLHDFEIQQLPEKTHITAAPNLREKLAAQLSDALAANQPLNQVSTVLETLIDTVEAKAAADGGTSTDATAQQTGPLLMLSANAFQHAAAFIQPLSDAQQFDPNTPENASAAELIAGPPDQIHDIAETFLELQQRLNEKITAETLKLYQIVQQQEDELQQLKKVYYDTIARTKALFTPEALKDHFNTHNHQTIYGSLANMTTLADPTEMQAYFKTPNQQNFDTAETLRATLQTCYTQIEAKQKQIQEQGDKTKLQKLMHETDGNVGETHKHTLNLFAKLLSFVGSSPDNLTKVLAQKLEIQDLARSVPELDLSRIFTALKQLIKQQLPKTRQLLSDDLLEPIAALINGSPSSIDSYLTIAALLHATIGVTQQQSATIDNLISVALIAAQSLMYHEHVHPINASQARILCHNLHTQLSSLNTTYSQLVMAQTATPVASYATTPIFFHPHPKPTGFVVCGNGFTPNVAVATHSDSQRHRNFYYDEQARHFLDTWQMYGFSGLRFSQIDDHNPLQRALMHYQTMLQQTHQAKQSGNLPHRALAGFADGLLVMSQLALDLINQAEQQTINKQPIDTPPPTALILTITHLDFGRLPALRGILKQIKQAAPEFKILIFANADLHTSLALPVSTTLIQSHGIFPTDSGDSFRTLHQYTAQRGAIIQPITTKLPTRGTPWQYLPLVQATDQLAQALNRFITELTASESPTDCSSITASVVQEKITQHQKTQDEKDNPSAATIIPVIQNYAGANHSYRIIGQVFMFLCQKQQMLPDMPKEQRNHFIDVIIVPRLQNRCGNNTTTARTLARKACTLAKPAAYNRAATGATKSILQTIFPAVLAQTSQPEAKQTDTAAPAPAAAPAQQAHAATPNHNNDGGGGFASGSSATLGAQNNKQLPQQSGKARPPSTLSATATAWSPKH